MGRFLKRKKRNRKLKADLRDQMEEQQIRAKFSKKNARKLKKIYGDLDPNDINAINEIQPYVGGMAEQLGEAGVPLDNPDDPIEVTTAYNTEILGEMPPEGYEEAYGEGYDDFGKEKAKNAIKTVFAGIAGAFGARKKQAEERAMKGQALTPADKAVMDINATGKSVVADVRKEEFSKAIKKVAPWVALAVLAYIIFK